MNMITKTIVSGPFQTNTYVVTHNGETVIIDPFEAEPVMKLIKKEKYKVKYVILTHYHIDHVLTANKFKAKVALHGNDAKILKEKEGNTNWQDRFLFPGIDSSFFDFAYPKIKIDIILKDKQVLDLGGMKMKIIHTPGHSPGGVCILAGDVLFSGDTLFRRSVGRFDFYGGDCDDLIKSVKKLLKLDDGVVVYPGHGPKTTIGYEKKNNPFYK